MHTAWHTDRKKELSVICFQKVIMQREKIMREMKKGVRKLKRNGITHTTITHAQQFGAEDNSSVQRKWGTLQNYLYPQFLDFSPDWGVENFVRTCFRRHDELDENFC